MEGALQSWGGSPPPHTTASGPCSEVLPLEVNVSTQSREMWCSGDEEGLRKPPPLGSIIETQPHICSEDGAASLYKYTSITGTSAPSVPPSHTIPSQPPQPQTADQSWGGALYLTCSAAWDEQ